LVNTEPLDAERLNVVAIDFKGQRLTLWKFDTAIWLVLEVVDQQRFRRWLAAVDDFRNWLIREAA